MKMLDKATNIACHAHLRQVDKAGQPYILHPLRVMMCFDNLDKMITAVQHDVVEDSNVSLEDLQNEGFPEHIVKAIDSLSQRNDESYKDFINRVKRNPLALKVKIADLEDNLDAKRLMKLKFKDWARFNKYLEAWHILQEEADN